MQKRLRSKNYLWTKGITENFCIDELFLVMVSRRYKAHICVVLNNRGTWSTTPWIKQCNCKLCFMCCSNGKEMSCRYYVPTGGNQVPSGVDETSIRKVKGLVHLCMSRNGPTSCQRVKKVRVFLSQRKGSWRLIHHSSPKSLISNTYWVVIPLLQNIWDPAKKQIANWFHNVSKKSG